MTLKKCRLSASIKKSYQLVSKKLRDTDDGTIAKEGWHRWAKQKLSFFLCPSFIPISLTFRITLCVKWK